MMIILEIREAISGADFATLVVVAVPKAKDGDEERREKGREALNDREGGRRPLVRQSSSLIASLDSLLLVSTASRHARS